jgi:hypothetical protein
MPMSPWPPPDHGRRRAGMGLVSLRSGRSGAHGDFADGVVGRVVEVTVSDETPPTWHEMPQPLLNPDRLTSHASPS